MPAEAFAPPARTPIEFNTIVVTDGMAMGTKGMRASLISREAIADSAELAVRGHSLDAVLFIVGCDKTIPAAAMAAARLDLPALVLYGGSIMPGHRGEGRSPSRTCSRQSAPTAPAQIDDAALKAVEIAACPGAGACGGQFTANTMALAMTFLGLSPMGMNDIPAVHPTRRRRRSGRPAGRRHAEARGRRPRA